MVYIISVKRNKQPRKETKVMTKRELDIFTNYATSNNRTLHDVYGTFSQAKEKAYDYCLGLMRKYDGSNFKIISFNTFMFTAGFTFTDEQGNDCMMYITPSQDKVIVL